MEGLVSRKFSSFEIVAYFPYYGISCFPKPPLLSEEREATSGRLLYVFDIIQWSLSCFILNSKVLIEEHLLVGNELHQCLFAVLIEVSWHNHSNKEKNGEE